MHLRAWATATTVAVVGGAIVFAPGVALAAQAQSKGEAVLLAATPNDGTPVVRVQRGGRLTLPMGNVTRIIPADEDVVRGAFDGNQAVVEGISPGTTLVEVHQGPTKRQLISVQVEEGTSIPRLAQNMSGTAASGTSVNKPPAAGSVVTPLPRSTAPATTTRPAPARAATPARTAAPVVVQSNTPIVVGTANNPTAALPDNADAPALNVPGRAGLFASLRVSPAEDNPSQALVTITYGNRGSVAARDVKLRSALDDVVSYVKGSGTGNPTQRPRR